MKEFKQRIKLAEMARLLSRSVKQFRADVRNYNIPCIRLGRTMLFEPEEVERYLLENQQTKFVSSPTEPPNSRAAKPPQISKSDSNQSDRYQTLLGLV